LFAENPASQEAGFFALRAFHAHDLVRKPVPTFRGHARALTSILLCGAMAAPQLTSNPPGG
jgi:hypothetical protein